MIPQSVPIPGWPYYLTIDGKVYRNGKSKPRKPVVRSGYYAVTLYDNDRSKVYGMGQLMRELYFDGTKLPLVHLDGCSANFAYWNLKPVPRSEVLKYHRKHGYNAKAVIETLPDGTENIYASAAECGRVIHVAAETVQKWCCGAHKNTVNENTYRWEDPVGDKRWIEQEKRGK